MNQGHYPYGSTSYNYNDFLTGNSHKNEIEDLKNSLLERDELIATLMQKVEGLEVNVPSKKQKNSKSSVKKGSIPKKGKSSTKARKNKKSNSPETPKRRHPLQLLTCEFPEGFKYTKDAFFIHIRILWGMIEEHSVPPSTDHSLLKEFNTRFSTNEQIENTAKNQRGTTLINEKEVQTLRDARAGRKKIGKHIVNLEDFYFHYIRSLLSRLGIRVWAPDLEEAPGFLYNEACRTVALMTFRQLACSGAYRYMRANISYLNDINLLHRAYDHFVHYLMTEKFKKENKQAGKNFEDDKKKVTQQRRQRLARKRYRFAVANNYPQRYLSVLQDVNSHSDDEFIPRFKSYAIKKLPYRSEMADVFFRNLDRKMSESNNLLGKPAPLRPRCRPIVPMPSSFTKAPKRMPLDFYPPDWFNNRDYAERFVVANTKQVAFIPTTDIQSAKRLNPDESLRDKAFNDKYWELVTQPYDLSHELDESSDDEEIGNDSESNEFSDGDLVDFENSESGESDEGKENNNEEFIHQNRRAEEVRWTADVDDEMVDDFDRPSNERSNAFFEEQLGTQVWQ